MNGKLNLQSPWEEVKEKLKEHNLSLSDDDLKYLPGKEDELFSRLGTRLNKNPQEVKEYIESLSSNKSQAG